MGRHIVELGKSLGTSVSKYNAFVGSLESSVMPKAREFKDLKVAGTSAPIAALSPVDLETRELRTRDAIWLVSRPLRHPKRPEAATACRIAISR